MPGLFPGGVSGEWDAAIPGNERGYRTCWGIPGVQPGSRKNFSKNFRKKFQKISGKIRKPGNSSGNATKNQTFMKYGVDNAYSAEAIHRSGKFSMPIRLFPAAHGTNQIISRRYRQEAVCRRANTSVYPKRQTLETRFSVPKRKYRGD
jgi:hypothetical protein